MAQQVATLLEHATLGRCELVRVEGTDWILRPLAGTQLFRLPSSRRHECTLIRHADGESAVPGRPGPSKPQAPTDAAKADRLRWKRAIESIRNGLEPSTAEARRFAVGIDSVLGEITSLLTRVDEDGGGAMVLRGPYGQGKTFGLRVLREMALEAGFLVASTEIDATENQLNKPHHIYRDLLRNLRIPGEPERGAPALARLASQSVRGRNRNWLRQELQCEPLAWLLSDPGLCNKPQLVGLLGNEPNISAYWARRVHASSQSPSDWISFNAGTQGDLASYLLSGIGRLVRIMGHKGLIVILDEMEKWQDLNWKAQSQAGNLLGGLIWGATAEEGSRTSNDKPITLNHSGRGGGFPFTTVNRCHLGIAIAMTPRGEAAPERLWATYGALREIDLPHLTVETLSAYVANLAPLYATTYELPAPNIPEITREALRGWRQRGDGAMRTAVQVVIETLDAWRDLVSPS
jgi:hypothetical protein